RLVRAERGARFMTTPVALGLAGLAVVLGLWWSLRIAWWRRPLPWRRPRVLMYHMVREHRPGARFNKLRVRPAEFERQVAWLRAKGFTFVFASRLFENEPLPARSVCLTFDDGYADNLEHADPVLERHGACATLYLVEERDGGWSSKKKAHHSDDELAGEPKLTDEQVRAMVASGRWELGGHTRTHAMLTALPDDAAREEIESARRTFPERFGAHPATFAYPFGIFGEKHSAMAREAGYIGAVTTEPGVPAAPTADPMRTPRVKVSGREGMLAFRVRLRDGRRGWRK
ncbi:MAG: polysaccharide deacetylase family protein, partial [Phycisphaerales bacterium]